MNFHQSPITRYIVTGPNQTCNPVGSPTTPGDTCFTQYPLFKNATINGLSYPNGYFVDYQDSIYNGWNFGRAVNVFFDTPFWPTSAIQINIKAVGAGSTNTTARLPIMVAPNVVLSDYASDSVSTGPYNTFIRGNAVFGNGRLYNSNTNTLESSSNTANLYVDYGGTVSYLDSGSTEVGCLSVGEVRLCYSGKLINIQPAGSRIGTTYQSWVKPGDTIQLTPVDTVIANPESNLAKFNRISAYDGGGANSNNPYPIITAMRAASSNGDYLIEFSALVDNSPLAGSGSGIYPSWETLGGSGGYSTYASVGNQAAFAANEIYFVPKSGTYKGLAADRLVCRVVGRDAAGNIVFTGTLAGAANLSYFVNNHSSIKNQYFDESKNNFVLTSAFAKSAELLVPAVTQADAADPTKSSLTFTVGKDASGIQPFKSLAIYDTASQVRYTVLEITATPLQ